MVFKQYESYLNMLWTLNSGDRVPLFVLILCILLTIEPTNFKKSYSQISEKHDQTFIDLTYYSTL